MSVSSFSKVRISSGISTPSSSPQCSPLASRASYRPGRRGSVQGRDARVLNALLALADCLLYWLQRLSPVERQRVDDARAFRAAQEAEIRRKVFAKARQIAVTDSRLTKPITLSSIYFRLPIHFSGPTVRCNSGVRACRSPWIQKRSNPNGQMCRRNSTTTQCLSACLVLYESIHHNSICTTFWLSHHTRRRGF